MGVMWGGGGGGGKCIKMTFSFQGRLRLPKLETVFMVCLWRSYWVGYLTGIQSRKQYVICVFTVFSRDYVFWRRCLDAQVWLAAARLVTGTITSHLANTVQTCIFYGQKASHCLIEVRWILMDLKWTHLNRRSASRLFSNSEQYSYSEDGDRYTFRKNDTYLPNYTASYHRCNLFVPISL